MPGFPLPTASRRTRFIGVALFSALTVLAGCSTEQNGVTIPQEAINRLGGISMDDILPRSEPKAFLASFDRYCAPYIGAPSKTKAVLEHDGYVKFAIIHGNAQAYAHPRGKPMVAIGKTNSGVPLCMVLSRENTALPRAVNSYLHKHFGARITEVTKFIPTRRDGKYRAWAATASGRQLLYVTLLKPDPNLGNIFAFTVGLAK